MSLTKATYSMILGAPANVLDYGASTSASAAANGVAFAAALAASSNVYIPAGTYAIDTIAVPNKRVRIFGEGIETTILQTTGTYGVNFDHFSSAYLSRFSVLENMSINAGAGTVGLMVNNGGIYANNLYIYGGDKGIYLANSVLGNYQNIVAAAKNYCVYVGTAPSPAIGEVVQLNNFVNVSCNPNAPTDYPFGLLVAGTVQFYLNTLVNFDAEKCNVGAKFLNPTGGLTVSKNTFINFWTEYDLTYHVYEDTNVFNTWINPYLRPGDALPSQFNKASCIMDVGSFSAQQYYAVSAGTTNTTYGLNIKDANSADLLTARSDGLITTATTGANGPYNYTTATAANMVVNSSGQFQRSTSALKYKKDVRDLEEIDINLLRPVRYKSKCESDDQTKDYFGIVADEAANNGLEELVLRGANGEIEGFQYERLTVVLLKKLQNLESEFNAYKASHI
jgi:hypothetical protein